MNLALWAVPAIITVVGTIAVMIVASRTAEEAGRLRLELARVADLRPSAEAIVAEARGLRTNRQGPTRR